MIEIQNTGSLFYLSQNEHEAVVVTTNGVIRKNGDAVLGKGQTLEAKKLVPAWKWDGEKEQSSHKEAPECGCVEFG